MRMRKLLSYLSYTGIPFISVCSSYAQYPDAKSLLGRLGIKIDKGGKLVADGTGGFLPEVYDALKVWDSEKLTAFCGDETALEEKRWLNHCISSIDSDISIEFYLTRGKGSVPNKADFGRIGDLVRSQEFLTGVFGKDFVSEFLETIAERSGMVYTDLTSCIDFQEYDCLCKKLRTLERKLGELERKKDEENSIVKNYQLRCKAYLERQEEMKSRIAKCKELLEKHVPRENKRYELLWKNWSVLDNISYNSDQKEVSLAVEGFLKELEHVFNGHPVWIAFSEVQALLPKYLESCSPVKEAYKAYREASIKWKEEEKKVRNEIKKSFEKYRNRFAGKEYLTNEETGEKFPISTEPLTVDIQIYQEHFEDANGVRKFYTEDWKRRVVELNIELRLTIDTRTRKLLSAFCMNRFIVNGQIITNFGSDGLRIFKSEQSQGFIEEKK